MRRASRIILAGVTIVLLAQIARAQDLPRGTIVDAVTCASDPAQSYALYLPSNYTPERRWPVLLGFHPAARGRAIVEKYAAAAEQHGYIVAASNNSRNGPWAVSAAAVAAMPADVARRFAIDSRRVYVTGMSGGARVAMLVALGNTDIAGVIASSAGFPDSQPKSHVAFAVFMTAGTEDFNYLEMRQIDRKLTSPHHLAIFNGGHTLPPNAVAREAIEWMELQAMKTSRRPREEAVIDRLLAARREAVSAAADPTAIVHMLEAITADFEGLRDVSAEAARVKTLTRQPDVRKALARERADDDGELRMVETVYGLEAGLGDDMRHAESLLRLRNELSRLARQANAEEDTPARNQARRVLRNIVAGASERVQDREYLAILQPYGARR
jgi:poly(3-hydroxybutyrate) depolymerase